MSVSLFVCLFGCYSAPLIIFGKCLDCYCQFRCCDTTVIFINHHPSLFFLFFHLSIGGEFKTFSSSGVVYSYPFVVWVSRLRWVLIIFVLQRVVFCFCLFSKLSLATTTGVDTSFSFIWHHLITMKRGQGMLALLADVIWARLCLIVSSMIDGGRGIT